MFFTSNNFLQHFPDNETKLFIDDIEWQRERTKLNNINHTQLPSLTLY